MSIPKSSKWLTLLISFTLGYQFITGQDARIAPSVSFEVSPGVVQPGDSVMVRLENRSADDISSNTCFTSLERLDGVEWTVVNTTFGHGQDAICTLGLHITDPGTASTFRAVVPADLAAGTYRLRTTVMQREKQGSFVD